MTGEELDAEIVAIKQQILSLGLAKEQLLRDTKLDRFVPNPKQLEFLQHSLIPRRAGFCGNRFGKSTIGVIEDICWMLGERPFFPKGHPLRTAGIPHRGIKGVVIAEDWDKVREIFTEDRNPEMPGKFFEWLPASKIVDTHRNAVGVVDMIVVENDIGGRKRRSTVFFETVRSYMTNPRGAESSDWDFIHVDEPIPQDMWKAMSRGLIDRGGFSWWLLTPLSEPWMYTDMVSNSAMEPDNFWFFEATMDDNPILTERDKKLYLALLTDEERECRQQGKPLAFGRLVFNRYDERRHLWSKRDANEDIVLPVDWKDWQTPPLEWMCGCAIDPHPQTPHAVLFVAVSPTGEVIVYDEIFDRCLLSDLAGKINQRRVKHHISFFLCDPIAWVRNPDTGRVWADTFYELGLPVIQASKEKSSGIILVNDLLGSQRQLWVAPHLSRFRKEIKSWHYDRENKPIDEDDHMMENFRRLVQHDKLTYREPPRPEKQVSSQPIRDEFASLNYQLAGMNSDSNYSLQ